MLQFAQLNLQLQQPRLLLLLLPPRCNLCNRAEPISSALRSTTIIMTTMAMTMTMMTAAEVEGCVRHNKPLPQPQLPVCVCVRPCECCMQNAKCLRALPMQAQPIRALETASGRRAKRRGGRQEEPIHIAGDSKCPGTLDAILITMKQRG